MLKRIAAFLILTVFLVSGLSVMAEESKINVSFDAVENEISISGDGYGNMLITVISDEKDINTLSESVKPDIYKQIKSFGSFTAVLTPTDTMVSGETYQVYVRDGEGEKSGTFKYFVYDADIVSVICDELKEKADKKDYKGFGEIISENAVALCVDTEKAVYIQYFDELAKYIAMQDIEDFRDFNQAFIYAEALIKAEKADEENLSAELKAASEVLGFDFNEFNEKVLSDDVLCENVWEFLAEAEFAESLCKDRDKTFKQIADNAIFCVQINSTEGYIGLQKLLTEDFADVFEDILSSSQYKKVKSKDKIYKALYGKLPFKSSEEFYEFFEEKTEEIYKSENKKPASTGGTGSTGGGAYSGGGTSVTTPIAQPGNTEEVVPSFSDVQKDYWGFEAIRMMSAYGAVNGYPDGSFKPSNPVSRAEFAAMLKMFAETAKTEVVADVEFDDVKNGDWYYSAVMLAGSKGIVSGYEGKFNPNENIKREDATLIVYRLLEKMGKAPMGSKKFADDSFVSEYAKEAVAAMGASGFVSGSGEGIFAPTESITRAQAAQLLYNVFIK